MDAHHWLLVKDHFNDALEVEGEERQRVLDQLDDRTRSDVEALLAADEGLLDERLDTSLLPEGIELAGPSLPDDTAGDSTGGEPTPLTGAALGPYQVGARIGRGGMGDVYRARRADGLFDRAVALKVVREGANTGMVLDRFAAERRILGSLEHPGIARLIAAGSEAAGPAAGRPWLALELVNGLPITEATRQLDAEDRVALLAEVAETVQYAHRRLVVHRDLKPSNVLVVEGENSERTIKLLDFGIAKLLDAEADAGLTAEHPARPMTRAYAAPEQIRSETITTATDVYGLGLLVFEVLTGTRPFSLNGSVRALEDAILNDDPPLASSITEGVEARTLRGDLDVICQTALAKAPEDRYASAEALASDLRRWLRREPIEARAPSVGYRLRRFVQRNRAGVLVAALVALVLGAGAVLYTVGLATERDRAEAALEEARREASTADRTAAFLESLFADADPTGADAGDRTARALLDVGSERLRTDLADEPDVLAALLATIGRAQRGLGRYTEADSALSDAAALYAQTGADPLGHRDALLQLANLRYRTEAYEDAERFARQALQLDSLHAAPRASERLPILNTLALVYSDTDRLNASARVLQEVIATRRSLDGEEEAVNLASNLSNLGIILLDLGRPAEAAPLLDEAIALTEQHRGAGHPYVAFALNSRSGVRQALGDLGGALDDQRRAVAVGAEALGDHHPFTDHARSVLVEMEARRDSIRIP